MKKKAYHHPFWNVLPHLLACCTTIGAVFSLQPPSTTFGGGISSGKTIYSNTVPPSKRMMTSSSDDDGYRKVQGPFSSFLASSEHFKWWGITPVWIPSGFDPEDGQNEEGWPNLEEVMLLACDDDAESRLISHTSNQDSSYRLQLGPFQQSHLHSILQTNSQQKRKHTLVLNDVDRFLPSLSDWIHSNFSCLPTWRRDDGQISLSPKDGSIGRHVDDYDVFLIQIRGSKTWTFSTKKVSPQKELRHLIPEIDVSILRDDVTQNDVSVVLHPGDVLYLPPRIVHYGIANTDDCMTLSVGCRAPSALDLMIRLTEDMTSSSRRSLEDGRSGGVVHRRYRETDLVTTDSSFEKAEITMEAKTEMKRLLLEAMKDSIEDDDRWDEFIGSFVTESKRVRHSYPVSLEELEEEERTNLGVWGDASKTVSTVLKGNGVLYQAEGIVFAYSTFPKKRLFANGKQWQVGNRNVPIDVIANERRLTRKSFEGRVVCEETVELLEELVEMGLLYGCCEEG